MEIEGPTQDLGIRPGDTAWLVLKAMPYLPTQQGVTLNSMPGTYRGLVEDEPGWIWFEHVFDDQAGRALLLKVSLDAVAMLGKPTEAPTITVPKMHLKL